jgi:hypothetical protein
VLARPLEGSSDVDCSWGFGSGFQLCTIVKVTTEGWIFMVGFRIFDVGLLVVWLVWFFRLRDDGEQPDDDGPGGGGKGPNPRKGPGGGGLGRPLGRLEQGSWRNRGTPMPRRTGRARGPEPLPSPAPSRIRRPRPPVPAHRRG